MSTILSYLHEFGRFQRNARLYLLSNILSGVTTGIILILYNLYLVSLGYKTDFIGLIYLVASIGAGIAIFPAGVCIDRFGGKRILIWSSAAIAVIGATQLVFRQPLPLLASSFLVGIAGAFPLVVNAPFLTRNSTPTERPQLFSLNIVVNLGTTVLGEVLGGTLPLWLRQVPWLMTTLPPVLNGFLASQPLPRSYQLAMLLAGVIAAPCFIPLFLMDDDRPQHPPSATPAALLLENGMSGESASKTSLRTIIIELRAYSTHPRKMLTSPFFTLLLVQALIATGAGLFIPYFNIYFVQHLGASSALFGLIDGGANTLNALLTLLAPLLAARIGRINTITITRLISIPLLLTIGLTHSLPLAAVLYLFRQGTMDMGVSLFQVFSMEAVPEQRRGLANSFYQVAANTPMVLSTPLGGWIIVHSGYPPLFLGAAAFYLIAIVGLWMRFRANSEHHAKHSNAPIKT